MSFTPKLKAGGLFESLVLMYQTTRHYIKEYCHIKFSSQSGQIYFLEINPFAQSVIRQFGVEKYAN
jgi:hypothetical protein